MSPSDARALRRWNAGLAVLHAGQGAAILALSDDTTLPVSLSVLSGPPGSAVTGGGEPVWDLPLGVFVAIFLLLAALDHAAVALPRVHAWYERNLGRGTNPARWWEYSLSASLMVVLIAMLAGVSEASALIALFGVNAAMILFGLAQEQRNPPGRAQVDWRPFVYGSLVGAVPWIAIGLQLARTEAESEVPGFVYGIFFSLLVLFFSFALNMALHYARVGAWRRIPVAERGYLVLSLTAKSLLAWQVFSATLAG